jgi:hypothetical protein
MQGLNRSKDVRGGEDSLRPGVNPLISLQPVVCGILRRFPARVLGADFALTLLAIHS